MLQWLQGNSNDPTCPNCDQMQPNKYFFKNTLSCIPSQVPPFFVFSTSQRYNGHLIRVYAACWASQVALAVKNLPANAGGIRDVGSFPGWGRSPGGGHGNAFQYSYLENSMDRGAWQATVHGLQKSQTRLSTNATDISGVQVRGHFRAQNTVEWPGEFCLLSPAPA